MSMLSGLTSKLRERAKALRQGHWSDGRDDALLMEDAADAIDTLHEACSDLCRESRRGSERYNNLYKMLKSLTWAIYTEYRIEAKWNEFSDLWDLKLSRAGLEERDRNYEIKIENGELKELVQDLKRNICRSHSNEPCEVCDAYDSGTNSCSYELRMRELGIESDNAQT